MIGEKVSFFKDLLTNIRTYLDTDEVDEPLEIDRSIPSSNSQSVQSDFVSTRRETPKLSQDYVVKHPTQMSRASANKDEKFAFSSNQLTEPKEESKSKIAIKYPRQYEDAPEIVDLLLLNESILIDFQYMMDAPARRCLDYLSGACTVLGGNLQKVGSSMYLLTPAYVVVNTDELGFVSSRRTEGNSFDYDLKR